ncbi:MAG: GSCFA domain-containing protein [Flavobacteriaceae bacterium]
MNLQTQIPIQKESRNPISYDSKILLLGSCFSENIGDLLSYYKFQVAQNPFGILFHPKAIENLIIQAINETVYSEEHLFFLNERWHSFDAHSNLSDSSKEGTLIELNNGIKVANRNLHSATHIVITLGTAWVYRHIESDSIVANCHKVPQKKFLKELLSIENIVMSLEAIVSLIKSVNREATITFTVSPIRHLKDGFIENQQSKSHLVAAIHQVVDGGRTSSYFPSYEIMMDELRDYRFYADDMIHPNRIAIQYIWEKYSNTWISETSRNTMLAIEKIQNGLAHKPFNSKSEAHKGFLRNLEMDIQKLQEKYPFITF